MNDKFDYVYNMKSGHWFRRDSEERGFALGRIIGTALGYLVLAAALYALVVMLFCL